MSLSSLLISCSVTPPDVPLCTQLSMNRGYCINTLSSTEFEVNDTQKYNEKTWWEMRPYMIFMPKDSWVEIKKFIIKICKRSKNCSNEHVSNWERTIEKIDQRMP